MKQTWVLILTSAIAMAMPTIGKADNILMITLNPNTAHELMPLFTRLVTGEIIAAIILGISAVKCCNILKNKN